MNFAKVCFLFSALLFVWAESEEKAGDLKTEEEVQKYTRPFIGDLAYFAEPFDNHDELDTNWVTSQAKKDGVDATIAKYDGEWRLKEPKVNPIQGDNGLVFLSEAKHAAIASMLKTPFKFEDKPFIVQYEVKFQNKHECGGAYVKLLAESSSLDIKQFTDKTQYSIMFGPDKCGGDGKVHFIFQHENPITNKMEEKHAKKPSGDFNHIFDDGKTHLMTLIVRPDNSFEVQVDKKKINEGSLLSDMEPSVNPPKEIDDPTDKKPEDWDEREKIPETDATKPDDWDEDAPKTISDPNASKPDGWLDDEPESVPDPAAVRPEDWDDEEDGEWEAPQINNPKCKAVGCGEWTAPMINNPDYKGKWTPPLIANPNYKGIWKPKRIDNPDYFEDNNPFAMKSIAAVGLELWSMQSNILFDNIIIADDVSTIAQWTAQTWDIKNVNEVANEPSAVGGLIQSFTEAASDKPWLWVVAVAAILLPLILIYVFCLSSSKDDSVAHQKKTDAPVPDDIQEDSDSAAEKSDSAANDTSNAKEEAKESDETEVEEVLKKDSDEKSKDEGTEEQEEQEEVVEEDKASSEENQQSSPSPRTRSRRKTRKDN